MVYSSLHKLSSLLLFFAWFLTVAVSAQQAKAALSIQINGTVTAGKTINITPSASGIVYIYSKPSSPLDVCGTTAIPINTALPSVTATAQDVTLKTALSSNDEVCVALVDTNMTGIAYASATPTLVGAAPVVPAHPAPAFVGSVLAGNVITITAEAGATLNVVDQPSANSNGIADCPASAALTTAVTQTFPIPDDTAQELTLKTALQAGDVICLASTIPASPAPLYSAKMVTVVAPPSAAVNPEFASALVGGSTIVILTGQQPALSTSATPTIAIYQFPAGYTAQGGDAAECTAKDIATLKASPLTVTTSGSSSTQSYVTLSNSAPPPFTATLASQLVAGTRLCLVQTDSTKTPATTLYSRFGDVSNPNDFGRVHINLTAGVIIDNQQNSTQSSTAAEYLDFGIYFNWLRAGGSQAQQKTSVTKPASTTSTTTTDGVTTTTTIPSKIPHSDPQKPYNSKIPGFDTFFNVKLSALPVSSQSTTSSGTGATPSISTVLNVMSSQQNAQFAFGNAVTWRMTRFFSNSNYFLLGAVAKAGFDTLLNPSINASSSTAATNTQTTTNNFSPLYHYWEGGARIQWAGISNNTDEAPHPYTQFDVTVGDYSNLPSYICNPAKPYGVSQGTTKPTSSGCTTTNTPPGVTSVQGAYYLDAYRVLIPRIRVQGFAKLPNYPFVLGLDANLGQYSFGQHFKQVDTLSKPGNDVSIYFGVQIDPLSAIKKLGLPNQ